MISALRGSVDIAGTAVADRQMAILANDGADAVCVAASEAARLLIVAGQPLNEPIAQYGPFVMNSEAEIQQTLRDYQAGKFATAEIAAL